MNRPHPRNREEQKESPKCPTCHYVMCEQFDEKRINAVATLVTPNGTYRCYHCQPITNDEVRP